MTEEELYKWYGAYKYICDKFPNINKRVVANNKFNMFKKNPKGYADVLLIYLMDYRRVNAGFVKKIQNCLKKNNEISYFNLCIEMSNTLKILKKL